MEDQTLSIGQVAARARIAPSAVRYYERQGLLPQPERVSGRRRYDADVVRRLGVIAVAKQAGFSLEEVKVLLDDADAGAPAHDRLQALATSKLPEIDALIRRAQAMRDWLALAQGCSCPTLEECVLFAA